MSAPNCWGLDTQRAIIAWKCDGLSEADAHRSLLPTSPLMTLAGIVSHMRWVEHLWFEIVLLGRPARGSQFDVDVEDADMRVEGIPLAQLLKDYAQQCGVSDEITATHALDDTGHHPDFNAKGSPRTIGKGKHRATGSLGVPHSAGPPQLLAGPGVVRRRICGCRECGSPGWGRPQYRCRPTG
ncbi:DinB family protein [Streptomyces malaysiensis]|nr:DinB family protein [Streptomyces malaysiensis]